MPDEEYVTQSAFLQFEKRIDEENQRQDGRLKGIDAKVDQISNLTVEISRVAGNTERILERLESHDSRIGVLEHRDTGASKFATMTQQITALEDGHAKNDNRLTALESKDGEMWRKFIGYVITAVIGIVLGAVAARFGLS